MPMLKSSRMCSAGLQMPLWKSIAVRKQILIQSILHKMYTVLCVMMHQRRLYSRMQLSISSNRRSRATAKGKLQVKNPQISAR